MKTRIGAFAAAALLSFPSMAQTDLPSSNDLQRAEIVWLSNTAGNSDFSSRSANSFLTQINTNAAQQATITRYLGGALSPSTGGLSLRRASGRAFLPGGEMLMDDLSPQCYAPGSGLIDWWQGETNAIDSVGGNDGTPVNGAGLDTGMVGSAFTLDGVDQAVMIPYANSMATTNFTVELWIYPNTGLDGKSQAFIFGQAYGRQLVITPKKGSTHSMVRLP
jgi:hypothetical protein